MIPILAPTTAPAMAPLRQVPRQQVESGGAQCGAGERIQCKSDHVIKSLNSAPIVAGLLIADLGIKIIETRGFSHVMAARAIAQRCGYRAVAPGAGLLRARVWRWRWPRGGRVCGRP